MGAMPAWALLALTLPQAEPAFIEGFTEGFAELAQSYRLALVGGDTTRGALTVSVAVHGFVPPGQALTRSAAQPGDVIFVPVKTQSYSLLAKLRDISQIVFQLGLSAAAVAAIQ